MRKNRAIITLLVFVFILLAATATPALAKTKHSKSYKLYRTDAEYYQWSTSKTPSGRTVYLKRGRTYYVDTNIPNSKRCGAGWGDHTDCNGATYISNPSYEYNLGHKRKFKWRGPTGKYRVDIPSHKNVRKATLKLRW